MRILIVGLGSIARKHIQAIRQCDNEAVIYALRSRPDSPWESEVRNVYSFDEVKDLCLDMVIISNPTAEHEKTISQFAELNIPLFIEKPLCDSIQIEYLISKCKHVLTYVACNLRFLEVLGWVKANIGIKRINEVNVYCGSYLPDWRKDVNFRKVYSANKAMGGGVHIDLIHEIDYVYWIFGVPEKVYKVFRNVSSLGIDAYDYANYCLDYSGFSASVVLNYYRRDYKRTLEVVFEDETWVVDLSKNTVYSGGKLLFQVENTMVNTLYAQMQYFMGLVKSNEVKSFNSIEESYKVLKICLE